MYFFVYFVGEIEDGRLFVVYLVGFYVSPVLEEEHFWFSAMDWLLEMTVLINGWHLWLFHFLPHWLSHSQSRYLREKRIIKKKKSIEEYVICMYFDLYSFARKSTQFQLCNQKRKFRELFPKIGLQFENQLTSLKCTLGLTLWTLSSSEFKFDDTRLSSWYKDMIVPIEKKSCVLTLQSHFATFFSMAQILFLLNEESLVSSNLDSKLFRFHSAHPSCTYDQSYEIKSPPWTILWFRILKIFSVGNIDRLGVFMFQTWDNSQLCIDSQYSSQKLTIVWSLKHRNTQPICIFSTG